MTALYMDGFDHYGSVVPGDEYFGISNMLNGNWAAVGGGNTFDSMVYKLVPPEWGPARTGSFCLGVRSPTNCVARKILPGAQSRLFVSFGFAIDQLSELQGQQHIIDFRDGSNTVLYSLGFDTSGRIQFWNGPRTTLNTITSGSVLMGQTWHFFEMEIDLVAGTFVLRVDDPAGSGTPTLTASVATSGTILNIGLGQYGGNAFNQVHMFWDDLFIRNGAGSINNGWLGDRRVATLFPTADTATSNWEPSYYKQFGTGILRLAHIRPNNNSPISPDCSIRTTSAASLNIGAGDFTLETWVRFDQLPSANNYSTIFSRWDFNQNQRSFRLLLGGTSYNSGCIQFDTTTDGTAATLETPVLYPWTPNTNEWYFLSLVRVGGELLLFVNGEQLGIPVPDTRTYYNPPTLVNSCNFTIGAETYRTTNVQTVAGSGLVGRMDETRFTNGVGRYTGPFSPPVTAFPRGVIDPDWASVVLLCGYNDGILDESSYSRVITTSSPTAPISQTPNDGPAIGAYSTVNKASPDDNTFITAALTAATNVLTMVTQPAPGDTVTVGTTDGATPAVYKFVSTLVDPYDVLIDTTAQDTLINLYNAINAGAGAGTKYGTGTLVNWDVTALQLPVGQIEVMANTSGSTGNSISSTATGTAAAWNTSTLTGGANIPGPTNFKFQRPPNNTTIISALQTSIRAGKTDSGLGSVQTSFIAPLGASEDGAVHNLSLSVNYYDDIIETDPDTSGPLSPTTIIGGQVQINRIS